MSKSPRVMIDETEHALGNYSYFIEIKSLSYVKMHQKNDFLNDWMGEDVEFINTSASFYKENQIKLLHTEKRIPLFGSNFSLRIFSQHLVKNFKNNYVEINNLYKLQKTEFVEWSYAPDNLREYDVFFWQGLEKETDGSYPCQAYIFFKNDFFESLCRAIFIKSSPNIKCFVKLKDAYYPDYYDQNLVDRAYIPKLDPNRDWVWFHGQIDSISFTIEN